MKKAVTTLLLLLGSTLLVQGQIPMPAGTIEVVINSAGSGVNPISAGFDMSGSMQNAAGINNAAIEGLNNQD